MKKLLICVLVMMLFLTSMVSALELCNAIYIRYNGVVGNFPIITMQSLVQCPKDFSANTKIGDGKIGGGTNDNIGKITNPLRQNKVLYFKLT